MTRRSHSASNIGTGASADAKPSGARPKTPPGQGATADLAVQCRGRGYVGREGSLSLFGLQKGRQGSPTRAASCPCVRSAARRASRKSRPRGEQRIWRAPGAYMARNDKKNGAWLGPARGEVSCPAHRACRLRRGLVSIRSLLRLGSCSSSRERPSRNMCDRFVSRLPREARGPAFLELFLLVFLVRRDIGR